MRLLIAALALTASSHTAPGPGPGLNEALWGAMVQRWVATLAWNEAVARNQWIEVMAANDVVPTSRPRRATSARRAPDGRATSTSHANSSWDGVAQCESGNDWATNTGNGYYGGLQENMAFWHAHGGDQYASRPDLASKEQQVIVAERAGSRAPWPVCGSR